MSHAFAPTFKQIPDAFRYLSVLKYMELSNNHLQHLRESTFHFQTELRTLKLQDCMIDVLHKGTFQVNINICDNIVKIIDKFNDFRVRVINF